MQADKGMMQDYDYHKNTEELPEYFKQDNSKKNNGCFFTFGCIIFVIVFVAVACYKCSKTVIDSQKHETQPTTIYQPDILPQVIHDKVGDSLKKEMDKLLKEPEVIPVPENKPSVSTLISAVYEEGYEEGYDDGEDDAVTGNEYETSYDNYCHYKGQRRKDYEEGYEEGYEAGYYDNTEE